MARKLVILAVLLLAGAALSIAIAVLAAMFSPLTPLGTVDYDSPHGRNPTGQTPPDSLRSFVPDEWIDLDPGTNASYRMYYSRHTGPAISVDSFVTDLTYYGMNYLKAGDRLAIGVRAGWPLPCLQCVGIDEPVPFGFGRSLPISPAWKGTAGETDRAMDVTVTIFGRVTVNRPIPASILPVGLAINSLFFAGALAVPMLLLIHMRRYRRLLKGHCPHCAYDLTNLDACPECNWAPRSPGPGE